MDVRCEKCQTEYELDEARLKPGGVTVKCTTCGHMFKIRKRSPTQSGIPVVKATPGSGPTATPGSGPTGAPRAPQARTSEPPLDARTTVRQPAARPPEPRGPESRGQPVSMPPPAADGDRTWIIRLDNGETRTCRDLHTLQQWIITGIATRESMISRSGKTWKRLGDIAELTSFFGVADEATHARGARGESGQHAMPRRDDFERRDDFDQEETTRPTPPAAERRTAVGVAAGPQAPRPAPGPAPLPAPPVAPRMPAPTPPPPPPAAVVAAVAPPPAAPPRVAAPPPAVLAAPPVTAPAPAPAPIAPPPAERKTAGWATEGAAPTLDADAGASGPRRGAIRAADGEGFGGVVRQVPTTDAAFTGGFGGDREPTLGELDDDLMPPRRGAGLWIALGSLVVIGGAAAAVYFAFLRPKRAKESAPVAVVLDAGTTGSAAGSAEPITPDAGSAPADAAGGGVGERVDEARAALGRDQASALIAAARALEADGEAAPALALRARLLTAQAQVVEDEAAFAPDKAQADKIRRDGKQLVLEALTLAQRALKQAATDADANLAMADVLRLQGKPAAEVRRYLSSAKGDAAVAREVALTTALLDLRDKQVGKAKDALTRLDSGDGALDRTGDVRVRWRLATIAVAEKQNDAARAAAEAVLGLSADHAGARALVAKLAKVATDDPLPPEDGSGGGSDPAGSGGGSGGSAGTGGGSSKPVVGEPSAADGYDKLLAKANKLAEVSCGQAMPYYQKAFEAKPNSVEALTGMGYCHLDAKQFSSAHSKFRAALGISPRYEGALRGIAELYQQQGRTELAIEAYKAYLEVYPNSTAAKRQLDRLQGKSGGGPTPPENGDGSGPTTSPTPEPTPAPEPTPEPPRPEPPADSPPSSP